MGGLLGRIGDIAFQLFHRLYPWRRLSMDKHRNSEIALGKPYGDHRQMLTDSVPAGGIRGLVALDLDGAAVRQKPKMMSRLLMTETHPLIAARVDARKMVFRSRRSLLGDCAQACDAKKQRKTEPDNFDSRARKLVVIYN